MIRWTILSVALYNTNVISLPIFIVLLAVTLYRGVYNVQTSRQKSTQEVFAEEVARGFARKWMK